MEEYADQKVKEAMKNCPKCGPGKPTECPKLPPPVQLPCKPSEGERVRAAGKTASDMSCSRDCPCSERRECVAESECAERLQEQKQEHSATCKVSGVSALRRFLDNNPARCNHSWRGCAELFQ